jgi:MFS family permease
MMPAREVGGAACTRPLRSAAAPSRRATTSRGRLGEPGGAGSADRLGDRLGLKRLYLCSLVGFVVASVLCGLSTSLDAMIVFRVL